MGSPSLCRFHDDCPLSELHRNTGIPSSALADGQDTHDGASGMQAPLLCLLHPFISGLTAGGARETERLSATSWAFASLMLCDVVMPGI